MRALNAERVDDFLDDARCAPDFNVEVAHRAIFVHYQPILDAKLTVQLVAIVALFRVSAHFYKNVDINGVKRSGRWREV